MILTYQRAPAVSLLVGLADFNNNPYHEDITAFGYDAKPVTVKSLPVKICKAPVSHCSYVFCKQKWFIIARNVYLHFAQVCVLCFLVGWKQPGTF
jgi:hypothetical protein